MLRVALTVLAVLSVASLDAADAASKRKRQKIRSYPPAVTTPMKSTVARPPGPSWAGPNDCYTDEGYGRYTPCSRGRGG